ncbi:hypothetical protein [Streptococcus uberis]
MSRIKRYGLLIGLFLMINVGIIGCNMQKKISVEKIHDEISFSKTNETELVQKYGKPDTIVNKPKLVNERYFCIGKDSKSIMNKIQSGSKFEETLSIDTKKIDRLLDKTEDAPFDKYYQYDNVSGLKYVRFYISKNKVYDYEFGEIENLSIAKKDKYLRQIME